MRRFSLLSRNTRNNKKTRLATFDIDESQECGWLGEQHFQEFLRFIIKSQRPSKMKRCNKCKKSFPYTNKYFYRDKRWLTGHCKECARERLLKYRTKNIDRTRILERKYIRTPKGREVMENQAFKYSLLKPLAAKAVKILDKAVKRGEIIRKPCVVCGEKKTHGHHPDYHKPLEVIWLCPLHHKQLHLGRISL
jgi:hypothetical protein